MGNKGVVKEMDGDIGHESDDGYGASLSR
uniref:Uncharacterized protein n=1 Tax=Vitis vinifera TaxID=29760 RepID=F6HW37_VITVI